MKAVRIIEGANTFTLQDIEPPVPVKGGAIVRMEAALVASYMSALPSEDWVTPPRPFVPGQCAIGIVERDTPSLRKGQRVYFDAFTGSRGAFDPRSDHGFLGCFAVGADAPAAMAEWPNGSFAELIHAPEDCFTPLPDMPYDATMLCRVGWLATALSGMEQGGIRPGAKVAINGATGLVGSGAVLLALALGAAKVTIFGRRKAILDSLVALDPRRVRIGTGGEDGFDLVLDCASGPDATNTAQLAARLARFGRIVVVGGLTSSAAIDTAALMRNSNALIGSYWFTKDVLHRVLSLLSSGILRLDPFTPTSFTLDRINDAITHATQGAGGLNHTVITV